MCVITIFTVYGKIIYTTFFEKDKKTFDFFVKCDRIDM